MKKETYKLLYTDLLNTLTALKNAIEEKEDVIFNDETQKKERVPKENLSQIKELYEKCDHLYKYGGRFYLVLTPDERSIIKSQIFDELCRNGYDQGSSEPNAYGLALEDLIDKLNHPLEEKNEQ